MLILIGGPEDGLYIDGRISCCLGPSRIADRVVIVCGTRIHYGEHRCGSRPITIRSLAFIWTPNPTETFQRQKPNAETAQSVSSSHTAP